MRSPRPTTTSSSSRTASQACHQRVSRYNFRIRRRGFVSAPGHGRCELICFCSNHTGSFADLEPSHARLVVDAWRHRTAELMARPGIEQVFCFENRGEEIGVTLTHPHGQIYGYPFVPPRTAAMLRQASAHRMRNGANLFADLLAHERADGSRVIAHTDLFTAFVPFAARWPVEVHIYPNRFVHNLVDLDGAELDGFVQIYLDVLGRFDRMYSKPLAVYFGAAPVRRQRRAARGLLPRRVDVDPAHGRQAEVSGRLRVGDGRVPQRRVTGKRRPAPAGALT